MYELLRISAVFAVAAIQSEPPNPARSAASNNLLVVTLDTVRADHLGCYGYFRDTTPNLDAFAASALRFTRCTTPVAQTTPSHVSLFTGVSPAEHGVGRNLTTQRTRERGHLGLATSPTLQTLAQSVSTVGMRTGAFVGAAPVKRSTGLNAGFETWTEPKSARRNGAETIADAIRFIDGGGAPFLVWIHLYDAHAPYLPTPKSKPCFERYQTDEALERWLRARSFPSHIDDPRMGDVAMCDEANTYDGALRWLDSTLATLFERLGKDDLRKTTTVVIVADHGTGLGQHDDLTHGICWNEQLTVPLLIRFPDGAARVVDTPMTTLDLWPTLAGPLPGLFAPRFLEQCRGRDVLAAAVEERPFFAYGASDPGLFSVTVGDWKCLFDPNGTAHLFDRIADPFEIDDVATGHRDIVDRMRRLLDQQLASERRRAELHQHGALDGGIADPTILEELRSLGYVEDGAETSTPPPNPPTDH